MSILEQKLAQEVQTVPEFLKQEVLDFVLFVKEKHLKLDIQKTPGVCGGEACVAGTRIAVWMLVEARRAGCKDEEILERIILGWMPPDCRARGPTQRATTRKLTKRF